ncbi:MAG: hypothetical protein ACE5JX_18860 [Acidobacteriota bacterium]
MRFESRGRQIIPLSDDANDPLIVWLRGFKFKWIQEDQSCPTEEWQSKKLFSFADEGARTWGYSRARPSEFARTIDLFSGKPGTPLHCDITKGTEAVKKIFPDLRWSGKHGD